MITLKTSLRVAVPTTRGKTERRERFPPSRFSSGSGTATRRLTENTVLENLARAWNLFCARPLKGKDGKFLSQDEFNEKCGLKVSYLQ